MHFHVVVLDGVFTRDVEGRVLFHAAHAPTTIELMAIVASVQKRALAWLRKRGLVDETAPEERSNEVPERAALDGCAQIALARGTYEKLPVDEEGDDQKDAQEPVVTFGAESDGFNLHAGVFIAAHDDVGRERLCRYGARPPLTLNRLRRLRDGRMAYRVKYARSGRSKYRVMAPLEMLARLSALIPPPISARALPRRARAEVVVEKGRGAETAGERRHVDEVRAREKERERQESRRIKGGRVFPFTAATEKTRARCARCDRDDAARWRQGACALGSSVEPARARLPTRADGATGPKHSARRALGTPGRRRALRRDAASRVGEASTQDIRRRRARVREVPRSPPRARRPE